MSEKLIDLIWKGLTLAILVLITYIIANWYFGGYDKQFCNNISPVHAAEYGCPAKG